MSKNNDTGMIMLELIREIRQDQKEQGTVLTQMQIDVARNTDDLELHMAQTRAVKSLAVEHRNEANARLEKLESPMIFLGKFKGLILAVGGLAGAFFAISRFFDLF